MKIKPPTIEIDPGKVNLASVTEVRAAINKAAIATHAEWNIYANVGKVTLHGEYQRNCGIYEGMQLILIALSDELHTVQDELTCQMELAFPEPPKG